MARQPRVAATQLTSIADTATCFQLAGADMKVLINPGALHHLDFKEDSSGTTDDLKFSFYGSNKDNPGDVPDSGRALAGSDWGVITEVVLDSGDSDIENVWQELLMSGYRYWACSVVRNSGSTDTFSCDLGYSDDGVSA